MKLFDKKPVSNLTKEDIDSIQLHMTYGGLKRATAIKPSEMFEATENLPTLFYVDEKDPKTSDIKYSIHAVTADVLKWIWKKNINESNETEVK